MPRKREQTELPPEALRFPLSEEWDEERLPDDPAVEPERFVFHVPSVERETKLSVVFPQKLLALANLPKTGNTRKHFR